VPDISNSSESQHWRELYRDCVLELDSVKLSQRIAEAESIIARRSAELLSDGGDHFQEQRDLSDAKWFACTSKHAQAAKRDSHHRLASKSRLIAITF
jgi:ParB-like chromosome segregation protein Spo0J